MNLPSSLHAIGRALRHRNFAIYTAGNSISLVGTWIQRLAIGWLTWELTGSGAWLGVVAFADLFPTILFGPIAGAAADRWDRLTVTRITQSLALCQSAVLFLLTATGMMTIELLVLLTAAGGVISAFNQPARLALVPSLVPRSDLVTAVAIVSIIFNLARFIGPAIAGVMIVTAGAAAAFAANAFTFAVFLVALSFLHASPSSKETERGSFLGQLKEGLTYSASHKGIAALLLLSIVSSIFSRPITELLPGFASAVFNSGADGLAILTSSIGIGAAGGRLWLGGRPQLGALPPVAPACSLLMPVATLLFTATDRLWAAVPLLVLVGFSMSSTGIASQTLVQVAVPASMRGRVLSLYGLIFRGGPAVGALAMGAASEHMGFRLPVAIGALIAAATSLWFLLNTQRLARELEDRDAIS